MDYDKMIALLKEKKASEERVSSLKNDIANTKALIATMESQLKEAEKLDKELEKQAKSAMKEGGL